MIFTRQEARGGANPESTPITHPGTNIHEVRTPSRTLFTQEHNELFIQRVLKYSQYVEGDELYFFLFGLNESSIEEDMKKSYRYPDRQFHLEKDQHAQFTDVMQMINEA